MTLNTVIHTAGQAIAIIGIGLAMAGMAIIVAICGDDAEEWIDAAGERLHHDRPAGAQ